MVCTENGEPGTPVISCYRSDLLISSNRSVTEYSQAHKHLSCTTQGIGAFFSNPELNSYLLCRRGREGKGHT